VDDRLAVRTRAPANGRGRPASLFSAAPEVGSEPGAREYAGLASALAAQIARTSPQPSADSIEAGRMWGRKLVRRSPADVAVSPARGAAGGQGPGPKTAKASTNPSPPKAYSAMSARRRVVALLDELGFAPSPNARLGIVKLRRCPLLEAAHQHPEVVCGVHLGVVRGALDELGCDPEKAERITLQPFSGPEACRLDLLPRSGSAT
jgi:predicted ArsR family transcriptional regulator